MVYVLVSTVLSLLNAFVANVEVKSLWVRVISVSADVTDGKPCDVSAKAIEVNVPETGECISDRDATSKALHEIPACYDRHLLGRVERDRWHEVAG
jgi:hypothetical protein